MKPLGLADVRYPRGLLDLPRPPDPLWCDGDLACLGRRAVSIVGTRRMTPYGARVARELAQACARAAIVVVSGLAQGIDSTAHRGALDGGGMTVAVLGAGIASHLTETRGRRRQLAAAIRSSGLLVSEFPPDAPARKWTFAQRDATIAALGELTVVVEAGADSGALITAAEARRLRRPVLAVPGPIGASASVGTNELIASGQARALTSGATLVEMLGVRADRQIERTDAGSARPVAPTAESRILDALAGAPVDPDALARRLGLSHAALAATLARLVIRGDIASTADGRLARR